MKPVKLSHTIYQGATFRGGNAYFTVPYKVREENGVIVNDETGIEVPLADYVPRDFTGCEARMQLRPEVGSAIVLAEFTTANGLIEFDGNWVNFPLSDEYTAALKYGENPNKGEWIKAIGHLEIVNPDGTVDRLAEITWRLNEEGTKAP